MAHGKKVEKVRRLVLILGDQLDRQSMALEGFDPKQDRIWMAEVREESTHVWSHKTRTALFLSAMRHFAGWLEKQKYPLHYRQIDETDNRGSLAAELEQAIVIYQPETLILVEPGDYRVLKNLQNISKAKKVPLEIRPDRHFFCSIDEFKNYAKGKKQLRMEFFYRWMRQRTGILMEEDKPIGGQWNFDADNRESFGKSGPGTIPEPRTFAPDKITKAVLHVVEKLFPDHPGKLESFDWPVTSEQAEEALQDFVEHRLFRFGQYQDAMWQDEPWLYHSRLSAAMNLKLLDPRQVLTVVQEAYQKGKAPLAAVEGFIRQILGWREYVRGIYWNYMPQYAEGNALQARQPLPQFYWTGETEMNCLKQAIGQTLEYGYAHHIQRLMVTGLYSLLLGVEPKQIHEWYLAVYVDAVEWVELPNTIGMSQFADGGIMASKPYAATGKYIQRMSNYCKGCRFHPEQSTGEDACPFTTLYWDFLMRHEDLLRANQRMSLQVKNIDRLDRETRQAIQERAKVIRQNDGEAP